MDKTVKICFSHNDDVRYIVWVKTANVFAEKVIVDPSNPIQNVKNNFIIPKDVPNAKQILL